MKTSARKHPLIFGIVVILVFWISMILFSTLLYEFAPDFLLNNGDFVAQGTVESFLALIGIGLAALFGYNGIWNERGKGFGSGILSSGYFVAVSTLALLEMIAYSLLPGFAAETEPLWKIIVFVLTAFLIGFAEETFFRGIIANLYFDKHAADPAGVWSAAVQSGVLFGSMHILNGLDSDALGVLVQVVAASIMGTALTAIYYRCRNIWALIFIHGYVDFCAMFQIGVFKGGSIDEAIGNYGALQLIATIPYIIVIIVLLRPKKLREIIAMRNNTALEALPEKLVSSKRSKISAAVSIIIVSVMFITVFGACMYSADADKVIDYYSTQTWTGNEKFSETAAEFTAPKTGDCKLVILSYPSDSSAYITFAVTDGENNEVYRRTFGGKNSLTETVRLEAGHKYTVTLYYDFSEVESEEPVNYTVKLSAEYTE